MACLRSREASRNASPNRAFSRCTNSLSSGTGFGGASFGGAGGAAGFGGAAAAGAPGVVGVDAAAGGVAAGGLAAGGAAVDFAASGSAGVAGTGGLAAMGSAGAAGTAGFSGLEGIEDFSAVPSGGFAAGPFFEGALTIGSIGCPRPPRPASPNRLAARLFNTLQKITSIALYPAPSVSAAPRYTQSSAPLRYSHTYPISKIPKNTSIVTKPYTPSCPYLMAHGNRKIVSTSKITKRIATM